METPFTIIRGGLAPEKPSPTEFTRFDRSRVLIDRLKAEIVAGRDQTLLKQRQKAKTR